MVVLFSVCFALPLLRHSKERRMLWCTAVEAEVGSMWEDDSIIIMQCNANATAVALVARLLALFPTCLRLY